MASTPTTSTEIYVARNGFATTYKGQKVIVYPGDTVQAGHWLLSNSPDSFEPLVVKYPNVKGQPAPPPPSAPPALTPPAAASAPAATAAAAA
jgi:hypothetical protein